MWGMRALIRRLVEASTFPTKSVGAKPGLKVALHGIGSVYTEPGDSEDSFPPAIASYEIVDGWLVYHGRNGSIGIVIGSKAELSKWMKDVDVSISITPTLDPSHAWTNADGGSALVKAAVKMARATLRKGGVRTKISVVVDKGETRGEAGGNSLTLFNVHKSSSVKMLGTNLPTHLAISAHEAAHLLFSRGGREVMAALKDYRAGGGKYLSMYHALAGDFEGTMEAAAMYMVKPTVLRKKAPSVYHAVAAWLG